MKVNRNTLSLLLLVSLTMFLYSACATRSAPTGGPRDETPPELLSVYPPNETLNYKGKEIILEFNEKVNIVDLQNQLLITPDLELEMESKIRKNTVTISFDTELPDSTTFTFNFRDAIVDLTENNPAQNLQLAFSTGPYIDSLSLSGQVWDLFTEKPIENAKVAIYEADDTLDIFNSKPLYVTTASKSGQFYFQNIKNDLFRIYAFVDKNRNGICESENEYYGFLPELVALDSNVSNLQIPIQFLDLRDIEIISDRQSGRYYYVNFNKYIIDYDLYSSSGDTLMSHFMEDHRSIRIYNTFPITDSLEIRINSMDSLYKTKVDTFYLQFEETERDPEEFISTITKADYYTDQGKLELRVNFNKPSYLLNKDSLYIQLDSVRRMFLKPDSSGHFINQNREYTLLLENDTLLAYYLKTSVSENRSKSGPQVILAPTSFISIDKDSSVEMSTKPRELSPETTGIIEGRTVPDSLRVRIELLDPSYNVVRSIKEPAFRFTYLKPDTYMIRAFVDSNDNGFWDPGNIKLNLPPEPIRYYEDTATGDRNIPIKSNWEVVDLTIPVYQSDTVTQIRD